MRTNLVVNLLNQFLPAGCISKPCVPLSCSSISYFPINPSISPRSVLASSSRPQSCSQPSRTFKNSRTQECCIPHWSTTIFYRFSYQSALLLEPSLDYWIDCEKRFSYILSSRRFSLAYISFCWSSEKDFHRHLSPLRHGVHVCSNYALGWLSITRGGRDSRDAHRIEQGDLEEAVRSSSRYFFKPRTRALCNPRRTDTASRLDAPSSLSKVSVVHFSKCVP